MVERKARVIAQRVTPGEAAVNGLLNGLLAGLVMLVALLLLALARGEAPRVLLARFSATADPSPWAGLLQHLAVSGFYGLAFGLLSHPLHLRSGRWAGMLLGLLYGALLFALAEAIILPGAGSGLASLPAWEFALAHLVYGLALGILQRR